MFAISAPSIPQAFTNKVLSFSHSTLICLQTICNGHSDSCEWNHGPHFVGPGVSSYDYGPTSRDVTVCRDCYANSRGRYCDTCIDGFYKVNSSTWIFFYFFLICFFFILFPFFYLVQVEKRCVCSNRCKQTSRNFKEVKSRQDYFCPWSTRLYGNPLLWRYHLVAMSCVEQMFTRWCLFT